jgi:GNAT superfamily N-acetyltransferase
MASVPLISEATPGDLAEVRTMLDEYAGWLGIDLSYQDFAHEVADLERRYFPPQGRLLIARIDSRVVGMVAYRERDAATAEMKRLYVRGDARRAGVGRLLVEGIIAAAREAGYSRMLLDTLPVMSSAQRLYESVGFKDVPPYYDSPIPGTRYMALALSV